MQNICRPDQKNGNKILNCKNFTMRIIIYSYTHKITNLSLLLVINVLISPVINYQAHCTAGHFLFYFMDSFIRSQQVIFKFFEHMLQIFKFIQLCISCTVPAPLILQNDRCILEMACRD